MSTILCFLLGHDIIREHNSEPLSHFICTRCRKRWYDREADELRNGYCETCARLHKMERAA